MEGVVEVTSGHLAGRREDGVWVFAGVPYGAPPKGHRRWRPAKPPRPWTGVRQAVEPGPVAPQTPPAPGTVLPGDPTDQDEDCLTLNLWTPGIDDGRRPVMVWVHGGGFSTGTGASFLYRGGALARRGDVVVVTCNYRLGALGFLAHPALADPQSGSVGNYGLMDQLAVLRWVKAHVSSFGGDPENVTIFGESAGGMSVACLLATPSAQGLFRRAVIQSGPPYTHSMVRAEEAAEELARRLGLPGVSRQALEAVPAQALVEVQAQMQAQTPRAGELPLPFLPTVDGQFLPEPPLQGMGRKRGGHVEVVIGTNRDEMAFFGLGQRQLMGIDQLGVERWVQRSAPGVEPFEVVETYRAARAERGLSVDPWHLWVAISTDIVFRWPSTRFANGHRRSQGQTFVYLFTWETPAFGGILGSCHALEIPFVFGSYNRSAVRAFVGGGQPGAQEVSAAMQDAWLAFAREGWPSHQGIGVWDRWEHTERPTMVFARGGTLRRGTEDPELEVWSDLEGFADLSVPAGPGDAPGVARPEVN